MPRDDESESLSIRRSIIVWVVGAVLGWGVAVIAVYGVLRYTGEPQIAQEETESDPSVAEEAEKVQEISPAAGGNEQDAQRGSNDTAEDATEAPPKE